MKYVVVGICIVAVVVIVALLIYRKKISSNAERTSEQDSGALITEHRSDLSEPDKNLDELIIQMELLPVEAIPDEGKLVEITDSKVLAHVNNLVPGLVQVGVAGNNAVQAANAGSEVLYRAIIPAGVKLTDSKAME